jgi:hypothetical protein
MGLVGRDYGKAAHKAAMAHIEACEEALVSVESEPDLISPASAPYCGCTTCQVREALHAAFPILVAGIRRELQEGREP